MWTIPAATAAMLVCERPDLVAALAPYGRAVGGRVEVDLDAVEEVMPALCQALWAYHCETADLWREVGAGRAAGRAFVTTTRLAVDHQQVTSKAGRTDLGRVFEDLSELALTRDLLDALTGGDPTLDELLARALDVGGTACQLQAGVWVARVPMPGAVAWPDSLGGPATLTETSRDLTLTARHAAWRDRKVRRLARVQVEVGEVWADPARARGLLPLA